jgi:hypothetical protein
MFKVIWDEEGNPQVDYNGEIKTIRNLKKSEATKLNAEGREQRKAAELILLSDKASKFEKQQARIEKIEGLKKQDAAMLKFMDLGIDTVSKSVD